MRNINLLLKQYKQLKTCRDKTTKKRETEKETENINNKKQEKQQTKHKDDQQRKHERDRERKNIDIRKTKRERT